MPAEVNGEHPLLHPDYGRFVGPVSGRRRTNGLRQMANKYWTSPIRSEIIPLFGGMPNPSTFPFRKVTVDLADGTSINIQVSFCDTGK